MDNETGTDSQSRLAAPLDFGELSRAAGRPPGIAPILQPARAEPASSIAWWAAAAAAIGHGMFVSDIGYTPVGLAWVGIGTVLAWVGLFFPIRWKWERLLSGSVCAAALFWQTRQLYSDSPIIRKNQITAVHVHEAA